MVGCWVSTKGRLDFVIKNNFLSFMYNLLTTILIFSLFLALTKLSSLPPYRVGTWELVLGVLLSLVTLMIFTLIGRFLLKDTGSFWKNACSVILPFVIGLYIAINVAATPHKMNLLVLYYGGYSAPFVLSLSPSTFSIARYENSLLYGVIFSLTPSVLYFLGLQWQSRIRKLVQLS